MDDKSDREAMLRFWQAIHDEVKPFQYWPADAGAIAHYLCEWRRTRRYYYINQTKNLMLKNNIKLTPTVEALLAEGDAWLMAGKVKGDSPKQAMRESQLESIFLFMANIMHKREGMTLAKAAHYTATAYKGIYKASTLERKYSESFAGSHVEKDLYYCIDTEMPDHYDHWTAVIEQLELDPELEGTRR